MQEILFRGKRIDNGEWAEGYLFDNSLLPTKRMFIGCLVITDSVEEAYFYEVDQDTIGQFTGLYDKNNKRIFEGDIVETAEGGFPVVFEDGAFRLFDRSFGRNEYMGLLSDYYQDNIEVIWNMFDELENLEENNEAD